MQCAALKPALQAKIGRAVTERSAGDCLLQTRLGEESPKNRYLFRTHVFRALCDVNGSRKTMRVPSSTRRRTRTKAFQISRRECACREWSHELADRIRPLFNPDFAEANSRAIPDGPQACCLRELKDCLHKIGKNKTGTMSMKFELPLDLN
jgi:hypothetical protein